MTLKTRQEVKALARETIREQRGTAILLGFVSFLLGGVSAIIDELTLSALGILAHAVVYWAGLFLLWVISVNSAGEHIKIYMREAAHVGALFSGLRIRFPEKLGGMLWMSLWLFLWSLLFVIPGIVKTFAYLMTPYILADSQTVNARQALHLSRRITAGYKGELFMVSLSFIGWALLTSLPFLLFTVIAAFALLAGNAMMAGIIGWAGILLSFAIFILFLVPYLNTTFAGCYVELRDAAIAEGKVSRAELGMETTKEDDRGHGFGSGVFQDYM